MTFPLCLSIRTGQAPGYVSHSHCMQVTCMNIKQVSCQLVCVGKGEYAGLSRTRLVRYAARAGTRLVAPARRIPVWDGDGFQPGSASNRWICASVSL